MAKDFNRGVIASADDDAPGFSVRDKSGLLNPVFPAVNRRTATVTSKTADFTVVTLNQIYDNAGASGTVVFTLPAVKASKGKTVLLNALAAQIVRALPVTGEIINLNGSAVVTKYLNIAAVIGNYAELYCDGVQWMVTGYAGVVTKEA